MRSIIMKPSLTLTRCKHPPSTGLKTKQSAAKRFLRIGRNGGGLKFGSAGKAHLNSKKSRVRKSRLNQKVIFIEMNIYHNVHVPYHDIPYMIIESTQRSYAKKYDIHLSGLRNRILFYTYSPEILMPNI
jgi:ribosomal protein L35